MTTVICVMGMTNSGKSTFMNAVAKLGYATIEVGKEMRLRYPPSYFQGLAAPAHTAVEAWTIFTSKLERAINDNERFIFVDGQPRDGKQAHALSVDIPKLPGVDEVKFVIITAPLAVRIERARARDEGDSEAIELSLRRMKTDARPLIDVMCILLENNCRVHSFASPFNVFTALESLTGCTDEDV